jgi:carboxyl-terminal processing protease
MAISPRLQRLGSFMAAIVLAASSVVRGAEALDPADTLARALWSDFLAKYHEFSLEQIPDDQLDGKARVLLLEKMQPPFKDWKPSDYPDLLSLAKAIREKDEKLGSFETVEKALHLLLPRIDTYGRYESSADVARYVEAVKHSAGGSVQMTIDQDETGRLLCFPQPYGPAAVAGVLPGAELLAVDGSPVERKELMVVKFAFIGPPASIVKIKVLQPHGKEEEIVITRDKEAPLVFGSVGPLGLNIRIRRFDPGAIDLFKQVLAEHPDAKRITIDLRGNPGGIRDDAFMAASMFVPQGVILGKFTTREGEHIVKDDNGVLYKPDSIRLVLDRRTASGAELLSAILRESLPDKVKLFGETSYGKSHSTAQVGLEGGGSMMITESVLATASGKGWDKVGLNPDNKEVK